MLFRSNGFTLHHVEEIEGDVLRKNYNHDFKGMSQYYTDLEKLVEDRPERFALITNPIHHKLDNTRSGITRLKLENRIRFCDLALRTVHLRAKK